MFYYWGISRDFSFFILSKLENLSLKSEINLHREKRVGGWLILEEWVILVIKRNFNKRKLFLETDERNLFWNFNYGDRLEKYFTVRRALSDPTARPERGRKYPIFILELLKFRF